MIRSLSVYSHRSSQMILHHHIRSKHLTLRIFTCFSSSANDEVEADDEVDLTDYLHGRRGRERKDSVDEKTLIDRQRHEKRIASIDLPRDENLVKELLNNGFGTKKRLKNLYALRLNKKQRPSVMLIGEEEEVNINEIDGNEQIVGAKGFATHLASASKDWPIFKHVLPEIAMAGHSNAGKSTLVNALCGVLPIRGPASISDRAGWTDQICFYRLGKRPPVLTLADLPGYGFAVATPAQKRFWVKMIRNYIQERIILSKCCVLIDSTRGLCFSDYKMIKYLEQHTIPWAIIMTKADLLSAEDLAKSIQIIRNDLEKFLNHNNTKDQKLLCSANIMIEILPVSAATGAGIKKLWQHLLYCVMNDTVMNDTVINMNNEYNSRIVREHYLKNELYHKKKQDLLQKNNKIKITGKLRRALKKK